MVVVAVGVGIWVVVVVVCFGMVEKGVDFVVFERIGGFAGWEVAGFAVGV